MCGWVQQTKTGLLRHRRYGRAIAAAAVDAKENFLLKQWKKFSAFQICALL